MKLTVIALVVVVGSGSLARAEPALVAPSSYLEAGATAGADGAVDWIYSGLSLDGGVRVTQGAWIHGELGVLGRTGYGPINGDITLISPSADAYAVRLGPEWRRCNDDGSACFVGGFDVGYRTGLLEGFVLAPRASVDVGGDHVRVRLGVEATMASQPDADPDSDAVYLPDFGIGATAGVAYQW